MFDMHSHILPNIDDGSSSVEMSIEMLRVLKEQGVDSVLLTPHFYAYAADIDRFIERRKQSLDRLLDALRNNPVDIALYVGAEALYFDDICSVDNVDKLTIEGTKYIMVEMPFSVWNDYMLDRIAKLIGKGYIPIIAHVDRYIGLQKNLKYFYRLSEMGAILQMNTFAMLTFSYRMRVRPLVRKGLISLIGTDSHNLTDRKPNFDVAVPFIEKMFSQRQYQYVLNRGRHILKNATRVY